MDRSFLYGIIVGIMMVFGSLLAVSLTEDIRWEPVKIQRR